MSTASPNDGHALVPDGTVAAKGKRMELHLDAIQTTTLRDVLDSVWRDLRYEIADTDNSRFKAALRDRESVIQSILEQLPAEVTAPPS